MRSDKISYSYYCNNLPSASLCVALINLFQNRYSKVFSVFSTSMFPYKRNDLSSNAIPALNIYPATSRFVGESFYQNSYLYMDFTFPGGTMIRERSTEIANVIVESVVYLILKNDNILEFLKFGLPDSHGNPTWGPFPGLVEIGQNIDVNYSEVNTNIKQQDTVKVSLKVSYRVDTVQWWQYIQEVLGNNVFDPCEFLYPLIEDYSLLVNLQSSQTITS